MRLKQYLLNEKYFGRCNIRKHSFGIFVNPSNKEMKDIDSEELRFTADSKTKKVYVWDANEAIHNDVWDEASSSIWDSGKFYGISESINYNRVINTWANMYKHKTGVSANKITMNCLEEHFDRQNARFGELIKYIKSKINN